MRSQRRLQLKKIFPEVKSLYGGGNVKLIVDCFWFCNIILVKVVILKHRRMSYSYNLLLLFYPGFIEAIAEFSQECFNLRNVKMHSILVGYTFHYSHSKELKLELTRFLFKTRRSIIWKLLVVDDYGKSTQRLLVDGALGRQSFILWASYFIPECRQLYSFVC